MKQSIIHVALVVREYDEAIRFYVDKLGFTLVEDTCQPEQNKRWMLVAPPGSTGTASAHRRPSRTARSRCSKIYTETAGTCSSEAAIAEANLTAARAAVSRSGRPE